MALTYDHNLLTRDSFQEGNLLRRATKFANVNAEKIAPCSKCTNMWSQREIHTLFQTKRVKIVTLFQSKTAQKPYTLANVNVGSVKGNRY